MNKIDRDWYKLLKILSKIPRDRFDKVKTKNTKEYDKYFQGTTWNELHKLGYINFNPDVNNIVTSSGLEQLRMLEDLRRKELTLWISIIAIVLSAVSFAKSMGWI